MKKEINSFLAHKVTKIFHHRHIAAQLIYDFRFERCRGRRVCKKKKKKNTTVNSYKNHTSNDGHVQW